MIGGKLWNIAYQIRKNGINPKLIKFINDGNISPYLELNFENLNYVYLNESEINIIEVNPYYRYFEIFYVLLDNNNKKFPLLKEIIFNCICHFLSEIEIRKGLTRRDYYLNFIEKEIKEGFLGEQLGKRFNNVFNKKEKNKMYNLILNMYRNGNSLEYFCEGIRSIFRQSIIYNYKNLEEDLIIYISSKETPKNIQKLELLKEIFLPLGINIRVFWEFHFVVIANDDTSLIGECKIF